MKDKRNMTEETEHLLVNERVKQQNKLWVIFFYYPNCGGRINEEIWK